MISEKPMMALSGVAQLVAHVRQELVLARFALSARSLGAPGLGLGLAQGR